MNTAEQIVDAYFRMCRDCFTISDRKVIDGNNRQLDILAYQLREKQAFHVEVGVTHRERWAETMATLNAKFDSKFFGRPGKRDSSSKNTDQAKGKFYFKNILDTYERVGFDPKTINRVWVCWMLDEAGHDNTAPRTVSYKPGHLDQEFKIEILSLRDFVLTELEREIGTAHYDDIILRTLGFIKQRGSQQADSGEEGD